jgi:phenylpyruvate tautomerase PptA (4-oxalocrotonate tautomerase family)
MVFVRVHVIKGRLSAAQKDELGTKLIQAVSDVEGLVNNERHKETSWVQFYEFEPENWYAPANLAGSSPDSRIQPWREAGQAWRRLQVRFPPEIATHNPDQVFYFDASGIQRRMDYIVEVNGSTLVGHYTSRYQTFDGLLVATRRRVFRRTPDNTVNLNLPSITLDIRDVELVRSRDEQAQP